MRIPLKNLETFSQCPAKAFFERTEEIPVNIELNIIQTVVKKCYLKATEFGFRVEWRRIVGWVDKMAFKNIDVLQEDSFKVGKKTAEHCLLFLRTWYEALYLKEDVAAYIDVELELDIGNHVICGTIPIIKTDGGAIQILQITDVYKENKHLFKSIEARGLAMLLSNHLVEDHVSVVSIAIGAKGGFKVAEIKTKIDDHARLRKTLTALGNAYQLNCNNPYPSVDMHCSSCIYKWRCTL